MKKLIVLLLAFVLAGAAFAQAPAPDISGSATLSWGVDLDTGYTGFANDSSSTIELTIVPQASSETKGEGVYGYILLEDYELLITNGAFGFTGPTVTAKIVMDKYYLTVFSAPDLAIDKVDSTHGVAGTLAAFTAGTAFGYDGDVAAELKVLSKGDWLLNTTNAYAVGADLSGSVNDMIEWEASVATDFDTVYAGVALPLTFKIAKGLTVTPAADLAILPTFDFEAGVDVELALSDANADDEYTAATSGVYFCTNEDIEAYVAFDEYLVGGLVENAEFGGKFAAVDVLKTSPLAWDFTAYAGYSYDVDDVNNLYVRGDFATDQAWANSLTAEVTFTNTAIANTEVGLSYKSGDLFASPAVLGTIIASATVSL